MPRLIPVLLMTLLMALPAIAQDNPIALRLQELTAAFNAGDGEAISAFYTEDGALIPPNANIVSGRAAIAAYYNAAFQAGVGSLSINILEIRGHGGVTAIEIGESTVQIGDAKAASRHMHIWVLQDGQWLLSRDMYHLR